MFWEAFTIDLLFIVGKIASRLFCLSSNITFINEKNVHSAVKSMHWDQ